MKIEGAFAAVAGTVLGSVVLGGLGLSALLIPCTEDSLDCLGPVVIAVFAVWAGFVVGSLVGCYAALRIRRYPDAGLTVAVLTLLGAVAGGAGALLATVPLPEGAFFPIGAACWVGLPLLARWIVSFRSSRRSVEI